ncbi:MULTISPECIES: ABC transporter permease [Marinomonas]|jgi:ABC-type spermidine/putrescine transport system, permease component II|uniref:ABC-type transporter, integral membrane subunit n=2 Tax=Marinomonas TaxID=28253 RepID=F2JZ02_MARM1|nr:MULTISPECIES: ABC transporter permease [Marinomonas]ADZ90867.1 ABC-type transporter, integral membrane subunit [Marinomonas mediterranea MMB-1]TDO99756.1 spermidine/putrescine transport system permease protein [Marinomonas balearica]WCN12948.1 ABC transporter permease subunit [Marinomonas mediterranea]WCN17017.1 ABC transporter permease subunit [Marinomonas mediterranea MMB-1]
MNKKSILSRLLSIYGVLFFIFLYAPVALIVLYSFNANPINIMIWDGFTLDWYRSIFGFSTSLNDSASYVDSTDQLLNAVVNSLIVALSATAISTVLGTSTALAVARYRFKFQGFYRMLMFVPMVMPDIVLGIALLVFFIGAGFSLGNTTIVIGHCTFLTSYVFIVVSARLSGMSSNIEYASSDLGANAITTFRKVTLPLILPGVVGGALLSFIISMDDLVITYFISGVDSTTLPVFILSMIRRGIKPEINAIATMMLLFSVVVASAGIYFRSKKVN